MVETMNDAVRHVAVYVPTLSGGGAERVAALLASGFVKSGWRTSLLTDFDDSANECLLSADIDKVTLGKSHSKSIMALAKFLLTSKPDVVLAVAGAANVKLTIAAKLIRSSARLILSYHGRSDVGRGRLGYAAYRFAPALARSADAIVCVSDSLLAHLRDDWGAPADRLKRIYNPVSVEHGIPCTADELAARPPIVVGLGRLNAEKGFSRLIDALPHLRDEVRIVIFGEGPERANLFAQAQRLNVEHRLEMPGYRKDPWPCYAMGRCFALASPREAFGNVVVEAMASGLPVVATRSGGPEEILNTDSVGTLVENGDTITLAEAIQKAIDDPGDPAPRFARARDFGVDATVNRYLELFNAVLSR
jgi:glycosyltransferase involved in cell wall biosynthesis